MEKERKFVVVDGSSLLVTAFWGNAPREMQRGTEEKDYELYYDKLLKTKAGVYTNAVYPMLKQIISIIRQQHPSHLAVVFDVDKNSLFRKQWYPGYKANRREKPLALKEQFQTVQDALKTMGIKVLYHEGFEADDLAGSLARKFEKDIPVRLMTKDMDYLQLINENVMVWMVQKDLVSTEALLDKYCQRDRNLPLKTIEFNELMVFLEYHVFPEQIVDLKAIQGDTSDNIRGINGVAKAAVPLIQKYENLEEIYKAVENTEEEKLKDEWKRLGLTRPPISKFKAEYDTVTGRSAKETALLSKKLAKIMCNVPIEENLDDFEVSLDREGYYKVKNELEITNL